MDRRAFLRRAGVSVGGLASGGLAGCGAPVAGAEWPQYGRGPRNRGRTASSGPTGEASVAWTAPVARVVGSMSASVAPAVAGGAVYATGTARLGDDETVAVTAHDARTGARRWRRELSGVLPGSPAVADGRAFVVVEGTLYALDAGTGETRWTRTLAGGPAGLVTPTVADGTVYAGGERLHAVDAASGEVLWRAPVGSVGAPAVGAELVVPTGGDGMVALDRTSGEAAWRQEFAGPIVRSAPVLADGRVVAVQGGVLVARDADTGESLWGRLSGLGAGRGMTRHHPTATPAVTDGTVFVTGERLYAFDFSGEERWSVDLPTAGRSTVTPAVADGVCYVGASVNLGGYDAETGEKVWWHPLVFEEAGVVRGALAVAGGTVFCRTGSALAAVREASS